MFKIGLFTFCGGYAMISLLDNEFVEKKKWIEKDEFLNMIAISESTPGPIAINAATYIGYKSAGFWGSLIGTVAVTIPSFAIIYVISLFFDAFLSLKLASYAFRGIQVAVIYIILTSGIDMLKDAKRDAISITILCATFAFMILFSIFAVGFSTVLYLLIGGAVGLFAYLIRKIGKSGGEGEK